MRIFATLLCLLALMVPALAQSNYAVVTGTVTDPQSLPVSGATVHFKAISTGAIRVLTSNDRGLFSAAALPPDDYELTTESTGFAPVKQSLHLEVGEKLAIEIGLKVDAVKEGVQVNAAADLLRTTDASVGEVVWRQSPECQLLLTGRRDQHRSNLQHAESESVSGRGYGVPGRNQQLHGRHGR